MGLLSNILAVAGWTVSYRDAPTSDLNDPALAGADLLIVLGGPIGVNDSDGYPFLKQEVALLRSRLAQDRPTLGICLGGQPRRARTWRAGSTRRRSRKSAGDRCSSRTPDDRHALGPWRPMPKCCTGAWRHVRPAGWLIHLAATKAVGNQAFSRGRNILALQFHLEADPARLEEWLSRPYRRADSRRCLGRGSARRHASRGAQAAPTGRSHIRPMAERAIGMR